MAPFLRTEEERDRMRRQQAAHPQLLARDPDTGLVKGKEVSSHALAARNARLLLKAAHPDTSFQVTSDAYSGGSSLHVKWTGWANAPAQNDILALLNGFRLGDSDGQTDGYVVDTHPERRAFRDTFGMVRFVLPSRTRPTAAQEAERDAAALSAALPATARRAARRRM